LINVNGLGSGGQHLDQVIASNIDGASNGIFLNGVEGVTISGNSVNNDNFWGVKILNSHDNTVTFLTVAHDGLSNPSSRTFPGNLGVFLMQHFAGGVLLENSDHNVVSRNLFSEDAFAGFVLVHSDFNVVTDVHSRYPDYFGGVLQDSSHNTINKISMQTADFVGLLVRGGGFNSITGSTFSANGPIGNEIRVQIVPYFISGIYLGWGTHNNTVTSDHANNGNTGPSLVVDDGVVVNPVPSPVQSVNPLNAADGNDPGVVPAGSAFDAGIPTPAGSGSVICGNTFASFYPSTINANAPC